MATIESLDKKIASKQKQLHELDSLLADIRKAEAANWVEDNPNYYDKSDLTEALRNKAIAEHELAIYELKKEAEVEKADTPKIKPIINFIEDYTNKLYFQYAELISSYFYDLSQISQIRSELNTLLAVPQLERDYFTTRRVQSSLTEAKRELAKAKDAKYSKLKSIAMCGTLDQTLFELRASMSKQADIWYQTLLDKMIKKANKIQHTVFDVTQSNELIGYMLSKDGKVFRIFCGFIGITKVDLDIRIYKLNASSEDYMNRYRYH